MELAATTFADAGAEVREVVLPDLFAGLEPANKTIMMYEGRRALAHEYNAHEDKLSDRLKAQMATGAVTDYDTYLDAIDCAQKCRAAFAEFMQGLDALITPAAPGEAPLGRESTGDATFNRPWTTMGTPCLTLPRHTGPNGLPVGVQLNGGFAKDDDLLAVGLWAEKALG